MTLLLAHGAGAGQSHPWMTRVVAAWAGARVRAKTFDFPYMAAGRSAPDRAPVLESHFASVWKDQMSQAAGPLFAAGKSMGGRIASQVAARNGFDPEPDGLIFFGYPLHPPGKPNQRRDKHLPDVTVPMLFLHGTRDPFGSPDELEALVRTLPNATLHIIEGGDHSLVALKRADPNGDSVERAVQFAFEWTQRLPRANRGVVKGLTS
ncbi:MAG: alpha/beta family hydrolase [Betaproteobacteria bacterium]